MSDRVSTTPLPTRTPVGTTPLLLATASYHVWHPSLGLPVITSIGAPRGFPPAERIGSLMPFGIFGNAKYDGDEQAARRAYRRRLHQRSDHIMERLADLGDKYPDVPLLLLCWEWRREDCHRGWLAEWLHDRHGLDVPEVTVDVPTAPSAVAWLPPQPSTKETNQ